MLTRRLRSTPSSMLGLAAGALLLASGALLTPTNFLAFLNLPGLLMVIGGTLAATLVCRPWQELRQASKKIKRWLRDDSADIGIDAAILVHMAERLRHGRIRLAEEENEGVSNPVLRHGLQMVFDQAQPHEISKVVDWQIHAQIDNEMRDAHLLRTMSNFAPAFGMLGTLIGLIHMLNGLDLRDLAVLGHAMAFAMTTTLYGIVMANMILKPLALKIEQRCKQHYQRMQVIKEGLLLVANRQHPVLLQETLSAMQHGGSFWDTNEIITLRNAA